MTVAVHGHGADNTLMAAPLAHDASLAQVDKQDFTVTATAAELVRLREIQHAPHAPLTAVKRANHGLMRRQQSVPQSHICTIAAVAAGREKRGRAQESERVRPLIVAMELQVRGNLMHSPDTQIASDVRRSKLVADAIEGQ